MRLWSLHPKHLDTKGLVALWREGLLAQACLAGKTKGYVNHSQLVRFKACSDPVKAIGSYLTVVHTESVRRGYKFDKSKIIATGTETISVTDRQIEYELSHLNGKLTTRAPEMIQIAPPDIHPLFCVVPGDIESWEKT